MKIAETEVVQKITQEVLTLFNVQNDIIAEHDLNGGILTTRALIDDDIFIKSGMLNPNEREGAEIHRLIKRNLYQIFVENFHHAPAPYGIMHGVRPTKIVHRWLRAGFGVNNGSIDRELIERRLVDEYLVSNEKARLLIEVAIRQLPILSTSDVRTISVYVGIPFCVTRCLYCSFPSNVLPNEKKLIEFMDALIKDINAARNSIDRHGFKVQTIYIGGGTPTSLPNDLFDQMLDRVTDAFYTDQVVEYTVESGRPDTITPQKINSMRNHHVTRISVNPQSMQQRTLDRIGRRHTPQDIIDAFNDLRRAADWQINMDLILGLPGETTADVIDSVSRVIDLNPDDITLHALALKRGSRLQMNLDDNVSTLSELNLPSDAEVRKMAAAASSMLRDKNYTPYYLYRQGYMSGQIENVGWCRAGAEGIYNVQIMDERQTIIGVGGAATTKVVDATNERLRSTFHAKDLITYIRDIDYYIARRTELLAEIYDHFDGNGGAT